jgi:ribosome-binding protein aMBF1 (putative translation factor)
MSDLERYIEKRKQRDSEFAQDFESGYLSFKIGILLRQARESVGVSQEEVAARLNIEASDISQIENQPEQASLSTLEKYAEVLGKRLQVELH